MRNLVKNMLAAGKLLPRQRLNALLDPGSPFLEIGTLAAHEVYEDTVPQRGDCGYWSNSWPRLHGPH